MNPQGSGSWAIRHEGTLILRKHGLLLYDGPESEAPQNILDIVAEMTVSWAEVPELFLPPKSKEPKIDFKEDGF